VEIDGIRDATMHAADIYPTILEYANVERPETFKGNDLHPLFGQSAKAFLQGDSELVRDTEQQPLCFEISGYKTVYKGDWKLKLGKAFNDNGEWVLINLKDDPTEKTDLSKMYPEKVKEMAQHWKDYSKSHGYIAPEGKMYVLDIGAEEFYRYKQD
ncbi:MAG: hypothetical protein MI975_06415, partial [Cytophagales bacterium]|nr:hypothetical protein [Cytophagales bacterium]